MLKDIFLEHQNQFPAFLLHLFGICRSRHVIIPEQMQNTVYEELRETFPEVDAGVAGLPHRGVCRYDHVTEELGGDPGEPALLHGKRDDVGWPLAVQILPVQLCYGGVVNDKYGEFAVRTAQGV